MYTDTTYVIIIFTVFTYFYLYLRYLKTVSLMKYNYSSIKCNPINMILGSVVDAKKGSELFNQCVAEHTKQKLYQQNQDNIKKYNTTVISNVQKLKNDVENTQNSVIEKQEELIDLMEESYDKINESVERQNKINQTIKESNVPLNTLTKSVSDMSEKFKETITTFLGSNMMTDLSAANSK